MRRLIGALALCTVSALCAAPAAAEDAQEMHAPATREPAPFDIIRSLQFLQDQVARGNDRAIRVQALLLRRFAPVFLEADSEVWNDPRNRRAAVLFTLSGGPPDVLARLVAAGRLPEEQRPLFEGALAYVMNDLKKAESLFGSLDLGQEEPGLAAHLHLVLGQIQQIDDPASAVAHLDQARLLAPGGLIEEAALRLQSMLVDGLGDHDQADRLARQYFDRYSRSSYAGNFEARFAAIQSSRGAEDPAAAAATMDEIVAGLSDERRGPIYLAVSRRALLEGQLEFARLTAERALSIATLDVGAAERARLYDVAASLSTRPEADVRAALSSVSRDRLQPEDAALLDAASEVLASIRKPLSELLPPVLPPADETAAAPSVVVERAERLLNETASDLKSAMR